MKKTWRIVLPLALATTLHAMVLAGVVQWHGGDTGGADGRAPAHTASLSVRLATGATPRPVQVDTDSLATAETPDTSAHSPSVAPVEAPPVLRTPVPPGNRFTETTAVTPEARSALGVPPPSLPTQPQDAAINAPAPTVVAAAQDDAEASTNEGQPDQPADRYHARRELSRPPKPLSPIDIVFPPGVPTPGRHKAVLSVYIDELGHVRKVRTEGEALPLAFEDAARNAFLSAQFRAGELDGRTVKSYIHVEVVFDEQPEARGLAVSSLGRDTR